MSSSTLAVFGGTPVLERGDYRQWPFVGNDERAAVLRALDRRIVSGGYAPEARALEQEFAALVGCRHALLTHAGTSAIELAVGALGIGPGDEVIVPAYTFIASAMCVLQRGAIPRFVDVREDTGLLDAELVAGAVNGRTKAIMPVHVHGTPCDMDPIRGIAERHGLAIVEDAAQAHLATYRGTPCGALGHTAGFSLQASKNLSAGEGGIFTTNDDALAERAIRIRSFGLDVRLPDHESFDPSAPLDGDRPLVSSMMGHMFRGNEMMAAFARAQLARLPEATRAAQANAERLIAALAELPGVRPPVVPSDRTSAFHKVRVGFDLDALGGDVPPRAFRAALMKALNAEGAYAVLWQDEPIPAHPIFRAFEGYGGGWPFRLAEDPEALRRSYDPACYPVARRVLDHSVILFSQSRPLIAQTRSVVDRFAEAFRKVWTDLDGLLRLAADERG
ncbi:MAG: DegT/DnrJ/EryC1/StrS family aminotransferase [Sandaracinaceae bacterium]